MRRWVLPSFIFVSLTALAANQANHFRRPVVFEQNMGQVKGDVRFVARTPRYTAFFSDDALVLTGTRDSNGVVLRIAFSRGKTSRIEGQRRLPQDIHYVGGPRRNFSVSSFEQVLYRDVWPGIDLLFYARGNDIEFDTRVRAGANISRIKFEFSGASRLHRSRGGELVAEVGDTRLSWHRAVAYQTGRGHRKRVRAEYHLVRNIATFSLDRYDHHRDLVIDPKLVWSTYLGGAQGVNDPFAGYFGGTETGNAVAVDVSGNVYVAGMTESLDFPTTTGAYQRSISLGCSPHGDCSDAAYISKFSSAGKLLWSTYYQAGGGPGGVSALGVDAVGRPYLLSQFRDFCCTGDTNWAQLAVFNSSGSALAFSKNIEDIHHCCDVGVWSRAMAVGAQGAAYIVGYTTSPALPVTANAYQQQLAAPPGGTDGFLAKVDPSLPPDQSIVYLTYFGGSANDGINGVATVNGRAYLTGATDSTDFPTTPGTYKPTFDGGGTFGQDAFVSEFNTNNTGAASLVYSTFLGSGSGQALTLDASRNVYALGVTRGAGYPVTPGAFQSTSGGGMCFTDPCTDLFVTKVNASASALIYSTLVGGNGADDTRTADGNTGKVLAVDNNGNAYFATGTNSANYPTTSDALRRTSKGGSCSDGDPYCDRDGVFTILNSTGSALLYSTLISGSNREHVSGLAMDSARNVYLVGQTFSGNFPVTSGAFQTSLKGQSDAFLMKFATAGACAASTTNLSITICTPANNATVTSPVHIVAKTTDSSAIQWIAAYVDGAKKYGVSAAWLDTSITMSAGTRRLTVQAKDAAGHLLSKTIYLNVK